MKNEPDHIKNNGPDHIQYLAKLDEENERLREALEEVKAQLRNDRLATRVRNALAIIDEALDDA